MLKASILYALQGLSVCWADRHDPRKAAQLDTIAESVAVASERVKWRGDRMVLAALLIAIAYHESRLCLDVHEGRKGMAGAVTLWQLERGANLTGYHAGLSLEDTTSAATAAATHLSRSWQCGATPAGFFRAYAGAGCETDFKSLKERVATYWFLRARLLRAERGAA